MSKKQKSVPEILTAAAKTFKERNAIYGDNYKGMHGDLMTAFFPDGITLVDHKDQIRYAAFNAIVAKLSRYANQWNEGGHQDSIHDVINFAAMLEEIDASC